MSERAVLRELVIPAQHGRAFEVMKGQVLRVIESEGPQVGDMTLFNLRDMRERLSPERTCTANQRSLRRAATLVSGSPWESVMMRVLDDRTGVHWIHSSRCCRLTYKIHFGLENHRNCQDNLAECLAPWGIPEHDIPGTFNLFMNVDVDSECRFSIKPPVAKKGDYIDLQAEMDLLVAISACPNDCGPTNDYAAKALKVEISAAR